MAACAFDLEQRAEAREHTLGEQAVQSTRRAYLDRPITLVCSLGSTPIQILPITGQKWWLQALRTVTGPTIISSFRCSALGNSVIAGGCT